MVSANYLTFFLPIFALFKLPIASEDPLLSADLFEGDIAGVSKKNLHHIITSDNFWDRNIPYLEDSNLDFSVKRAISKAKKQLQTKTCLRLVPKRSSNRDYIHFKAGTGCSSYIGKQGGEQQAVLDESCGSVGVILHLFMHILGFWHENSRSDRDEYLLVNWKNVREGNTQLCMIKIGTTCPLVCFCLEKIDNFKAYTSPKSNHLGEPFDYHSLMHISPYAFALNSTEMTILTKDERFKLGQRISFSDGDINKILIRYCGKVVPQDAAPADSPVVPPTLPSPLNLVDLRRNRPCTDRSMKCPLWATQGHCYKKPELMAEQCQESCMTCRGAQRCEDYNALCGVWAWLGRCTEGGTVRKILRTCPLSCSVCVPEGTITDASSCTDLHESCNKWAGRGRCFYQHILKLCPHSCRLCGSHFLRSEQEMCEDERNFRKYCRRMSSAGFCYRSSVRRRCPRSCGSCDSKVRNRRLEIQRCRDSHLFCEFISGPEDIFCASGSLQRVCPASCGSCH